MKKNELQHRVDNTKSEIKDACQTIYDALNQGQKKKVVKNAEVKAIFDRYGVEYEE